MKKTIRFQKTDAAQQIASGLIFAPMVLDSQGDFMTPEGIEAASQRFMKSGRTTSVDVNHSGVPVNAFISESLIAEGDDTFPDGSWLASVKIEDPDLWALVEASQLTGFSMEGTGSKTPTTLGGKAANLLSNVEVFSISLVKRSANREKFSVIKEDTNGQTFADACTLIATAISKQSKTLLKIDKQLIRQSQKMNKALGLPDDEPDDVEVAVQKMEDIKKAERIGFLERKIGALQDKWEVMIERPEFGGREAKIREQIEDCECELVSLGKSESNPFDSASAFFQRGGTSDFLVVPEGNNFSNPFGISTPDQISKKDQAPFDSNTMGINDLDESDVDLNSIMV
jgi:hypothetical protein